MQKLCKEDNYVYHKSSIFNKKQKTMNLQKLFLTLLVLCLGFGVSFSQNTLYVSPSGSASNSGTSSASPTTLQNAIVNITSGGTINVASGTYNFSSTILIQGKNGASGSLIKVFASGGTPVFNFSALPLSTSNRGVVLNANYWHFKGIIFEKAGDNGMLLSGNNNTIESCVFRGNQDTGLQLSRYNSAYTAISQWPSNNLILNCEAYDNKDPDSEDADGFAAKLTCGTGNVFRGCVSHHNIDDGWDLYTKPDTGPIGAITFENCIAHSNGILTTGGTSGNGDKNGFKLGGEDISVNHILRRCIAFNNGKHGFTYNRNLGSIEMTNCTGYNNAQRNFSFDAGTHVFKNNLSYISGSNDKAVGTSTAPNSFTGATGGFTINSADFQTLTPGANANPTSGGFLNLVSGSDAVNAGVTSSGITYAGSAPDLGAIEFGGTTPTTYTLNVSVSGSGTVTKNPNKTSYTSGETVTLTATAASGSSFSGWSGDASGTSTSTTVTMNSNKNVTATFAGSPQTYTLTVNTVGSGSVTKNPNKTTYNAGEVVTLTATPASGYAFSSWSGDANGTSASTTVTMSANRTVTATFSVVSSGNTIRIEDSNTTATGLCSYDGSISSNSGANNGKVINLSNSSAKGITWKVNAPVSGSYTLVWRYKNSGSSAATTAALKINTTTVNSALPFPKTSSSTTFTTTTATVNLISGINQIRLETTVSSEFADIDWIEITGNNPTAANCAASLQISKVDNSATTPENNKMVLFPNPSKGNAKIKFGLAEQGKVSIQVLSHTGQLMKNISGKSFAKGENEISLEHIGLKSGTYFVRVITQKGTQVLRMVVK
jgi:pectate disaccharide-lyase